MGQQVDARMGIGGLSVLAVLSQGHMAVDLHVRVRRNQRRLRHVPDFGGDGGVTLAAVEAHAVAPRHAVCHA